MPEIIPNQTFKHDTKTYEEGEKYDVAPELAFYFKTVGWVGEKPEASSRAVTLDIQDGVLGHGAEVK